ncbi:MAG: SRPBCC family protein [Acidimicrobiales bacterium]
MTDERLQVERTIAADAASIFRVLCDPQGHVAIDSSGMLLDATGNAVAAVGDTFVVHMDREALNDYPMGRYDVTVTITTFVPDREIAWTILGAIRPAIGHVYGYILAPSDDGTLVTSYYDWSSIDPVWREAGIFPVLSEGALRATLGILARRVAGGLLHPRRPVTAGEPTHIELGAPDAKKAKVFFGSLLGWTFEPFGEGDQAAIQTPSIRGGLHDGVTTATLVTYFKVDDIEAAVAHVRALGGAAGDPSPPEPGFGRFSTCTDDQGTPFGLHQS